MFISLQDHINKIWNAAYLHKHISQYKFYLIFLVTDSLYILHCRSKIKPITLETDVLNKMITFDFNKNFRKYIQLCLSYKIRIKNIQYFNMFLKSLIKN